MKRERDAKKDAKEQHDAHELRLILQKVLVISYPHLYASSTTQEIVNVLRFVLYNLFETSSKCL